MTACAASSARTLLDGPVLHDRPAGTAPYGTDASELQDLAPCVILGPGGITTAHTPHECVALADLEAACELFGRLLQDTP